MRFCHRSSVIGGISGVLCLVLFCSEAHATVFKTRGRNWDGWIPLNGLPWEKAYQTQMLVNGRRVGLHVYTARYTEPVAEQMKNILATLGAKVKTLPSGDGGAAELTGYEVRYLIVSPQSEPMHYIFITYMDPNGSEDSAFPVPLYPNGEVTSKVTDTKTHADFATVKTTDAATQVHAFYRDRLVSEGWVQVKPYMVSNGESSGLAIYKKRSYICHVDVVPGRKIYSMVAIMVEKGNRAGFP